jgi:hypothetical protein
VRRRSFLCTPLLLPTLALAAPVRPPVAYAPVSRGVELAFPRDHGAHPDFRTEWWYVTGALDSPQADIGFQLTFFRSRPGSAEALRSPLAARQILFAHAALSIPGDRLLHSERAARANLGAGFSSSDCDVHIGAWRMQREDRSTGEVFRLQMQSAPVLVRFHADASATLNAAGRWRLFTQRPRAPTWPATTSAGHSCRSLARWSSTASASRPAAVPGSITNGRPPTLAVAPSAGTGWASTSTNGGALMAFSHARRARRDAFHARGLARCPRPCAPVRRQGSRLHADPQLVLAAQPRQLPGADRNPSRRAQRAHATDSRRSGTRDQSAAARRLLGRSWSVWKAASAAAATWK